MADDWYIRINNVDRGPLSAETLKQLALEGKITPKTPLKKGPSGSWALASGLKGLFPMAASAGAPHISPSAPHPKPAPLVQAVPLQVAVPPSASRGLGRIALTAVRQVDRSLLKMVGGEQFIILYRFLQVVVVCIPVGAVVITMAIRNSNRQAEQARIDAANQEVRQAVEKAEKWIQAGRLADADKIEEGLNAAEANSVATQTTSIGPTLVAFRKAKDERQASRLLEFAVDAIAFKRFDKAQNLLRQYLAQEHATERRKAETLLAEIAFATSDSEAMSTLLAMDDDSFSNFLRGDFSAVVLSHPVLIETRIATLKKNLAEAGRQREETRKRTEVQRIAAQKRIEAEKEAIRHREQLAEKTRLAEKEAIERRQQLAEKEKQEEEKVISYEVLRKWDVGSNFSMEILVNSTASRQDVLNLAQSLVRRYARKYDTIDIFDSREAWRSRGEEGYPEKEYWRHYLVQIGGEWKDGQEIHWLAEGRGQ